MHDGVNDAAFGPVTRVDIFGLARWKVARHLDSARRRDIDRAAQTCIEIVAHGPAGIDNECLAGADSHRRGIGGHHDQRGTNGW